MGAARRVKAHVTLMQMRRGGSDQHSSAVKRRSRVEASSTRDVSRNVLAALIVGLALTAAASGFIAYANGPHASRANREVDASQDCSARYAALLDLAELARRDGKSSEIVVRGLSERGGALSVCLPTSRGEPPPR
jgi:hypothetical protein